MEEWRTQQDSQAMMSNGGTGDIRTMEEFSTFVGLSRPTVSKYFNAPESVRPSTRQRIEAAIEASGFTPNLFATNLKRARTRVLGIIVPTATDPFYMELVRQMEELASRAGYVLFMLSSNGRADREVEAISRLESMNIAGAIVVPLGTKGPSARLASLERRSSIVYVDSAPDASTPFVGTDNAQSIGLMVEYLCRSGEPPSFLPMPPINRNAEARLAAYEEAMAQAHESTRVLAVPKRLDWDFERYGHNQTRQALEVGLPTRTILCANDRIALGALLAAWQADVHVGRTANSQLRIAGHDDHPFARYSGPPLTTVSQDIQGIAQRTMATLMARIGEPEADGGPMHETALFAGQLVLRDSA